MPKASSTIRKHIKTVTKPDTLPAFLMVVSTVRGDAVEKQLDETLILLCFEKRNTYDVHCIGLENNACFWSVSEQTRENLCLCTHTQSYAHMHRQETKSVLIFMIFIENICPSAFSQKVIFLHNSPKKIWVLFHNSDIWSYF